MAVPNSCSTVSGFQGPRPPRGGLPRQAARLYITRVRHICQQLISTFLFFFADEALNERMSPAHHPQQHGCLPYAERVSGSASAEYDALKAERLSTRGQPSKEQERRFLRGT